MTTEPLNPSVTPLYQGRYAENTAGIIAAITACIVAAGGAVTSYPSNTAGIIQALIDLQTVLSGGPGGSGLSVRMPLQAGEPLAACDAVYVGSDGKVYKATSNSAFQQANVLGFSWHAAAANESVTVIARGGLQGFSGLVAGQEYYLGISGAITTTAPIGGGMYLTRIGQALSSEVLDVQPETPVLLN